MKNLTLLNNPSTTSTTQPVECLGLSFENDEARRAYFLDILRDKLQQSDFKKIAGFPHATDETILALSNPPYYTACPNPWLPDFLELWAKSQKSLLTQSYHREPFAADVSEGKNDPIYNAHSYHTKVPYKAIMRYILHYTEPGDVVFDGFCGTGMTGVAAQLCGDKQEVEALGYRVLADGTIKAATENENGKKLFKPFSKLGTRRAILNDLSPAATFIAYNYNTPVDIIAFEQEAQRILEEVETECGWMYQTLHSCARDTEIYNEEIKQVVLGTQDIPTWINLGCINYIVWSEVFICPQCAGELIFWEVAVDTETGKVHNKFPCPHCATELTKRNLERARILRFDKAIAETNQQTKQVPVLINYSIGNTRFEKNPDKFDFALLEKIEKLDIPYWFPTDTIPKGDKTNEPLRFGITHVHHFYTKRNLWILAALTSKYTNNNTRINAVLQLLISSYNLTHSTIMSRIIFKKGGTKPVLTGYQSGTLYISSLPVEKNIIEALSHKKVKLFSEALSKLKSQNIVECKSSSVFNLKNNSIDYIFLDPPFGSNIMYSEMNFLWEAWLKVFTNNQPEAIINRAQKKDLSDYRNLMVDCFKQAFRILKPGRWMTVEFSNSQATVWNTLQTTLQEAGFIIANVSALDKKQGSFNAVTNTTAVKQDLIISAYKPNRGLEQTFKKAGGEETSVWEFIRYHLKYLPLTKTKGETLEFIAERDPRILYDRIVAYFISHGYPVPLSSQQFQAGLREHFQEKDGMIFLLEQIEAYEQKRKLATQKPQLELFIYDERSAIDWLQHFLKKRPSTRQEIHPEFTKLIGAGWKKYEILPELDPLLEFNFLKYNGIGSVPSQIHAYLSSNYKNCRHLTKDEPLLQQRATERWYVPDTSRGLDLEKLRENQLLREFKQYCQNTKKHLKEFRLEALRAGFKKAWVNKEYQTIIEMAKKIPEAVLYEDEKLLQLYDLAIIRISDQ